MWQTKKKMKKPLQGRLYWNQKQENLITYYYYIIIIIIIIIT